MKLVLEIHPPHGNHEAVTHVVVDQFPVRIGRGFDNHVILNDPYVSVRHAEISFNGIGFSAHDLQSENGLVVVNDKGAVTARRQPTAGVKSGDSLRLGQTEIRLYDPHHALPAALPMQKENTLLLRLGRALVAWPLFFLAVLTIMAWTYFEAWTEEPAATMAVAAGSGFAVILIWSALWAAAGRLIRHQSHFMAHMGLASLYMIFSAAFWYVETYINFLTNENLFAEAVRYVLNFLLLAPLIYGALRLATRMPRSRRRFAAAFFSFGLLGGILLFGLVSAKAFEQSPYYASTLEPYLSDWASAQSVETFMAENKAFFKRLDKD